MSQPKKISDAGIALLVEFEGEILRVYNDPVGLPTLGVGHLVTAAEKKDYPVGKKITKATSRAFLRRDVERFEDCINSSVKVPITQNQFDALLSLAFNIGETNFKRSSVLRNLNNRQFDKAADAFTAWNKAKKNGKLTVLPGLTRRRNAERSVFLSPDDPNSATAQPSGDSAATKDDSKPLDTPPVPAEPLPITNSDPAESAPVQVTTGSGVTNWLFGGGTMTAVGTAVWAWVTSNANIVAIAVICVTVLILAVIFRKAILDAIRLNLNADPNKHNVT